MPEDSEVVIEEASLLDIMRKYKSTSLDPSEQSRDGKICKVPQHKRPLENTNPYTPRIISIGPLHHGEPELQPMEDLKKKYLDNLLKRQQGKDYDALLQSLLMAARELEKKARHFYESSSLKISSEDFVNILVIDGCFLIEFFCKTKHDQITLDEIGWQLPLIKLDILLFENQIPFFVLKKLFHLFPEFDGGDMISHARSYVEDTEIIRDKQTKVWAAFTGGSTVTSPFGKVSHLLHLHHTIMFETKFHSPSSKKSSIMSVIVGILLRLFLIVTFPLVSVLRLCFADNTYRTKRTSAMELEEAGVKFRGSFGDLRFEKGTLFVPFLTLNHKSFCIFKNLLALEFYDKGKVRPYAHEYASFLSHLIKHSGDLKVMEKHNIIKGGRGDEESVQLVRDIVEGQLLSQDQEHLRKTLLEYCNKNRHLWRAKLMKDYFGNPWSIIGLLVGVILLVLTTLQTVLCSLCYLIMTNKEVAD